MSRTSKMTDNLDNVSRVSVTTPKAMSERSDQVSYVSIKTNTTTTTTKEKLAEVQVQLEKERARRLEAER